MDEEAVSHSTSVRVRLTPWRTGTKLDQTNASSAVGSLVRTLVKLESFLCRALSTWVMSGFALGRGELSQGENQVLE